MFLQARDAFALLALSLLCHGLPAAEDVHALVAPQSYDIQTNFKPKNLPLNLFDASLDELAQGLHAKRLTSLKLVHAYKARINAVSHLNSIIEFNPLASTHALAADAERRIAILKNQTLPPLHGIPILIKDNIATSPDLGNTTAGSFALFGSVTRADSTLVRKLRENGAIILGKTNMDEFAKAREAGPWGWSARGGQMQNPFYPNGSTSGSSGGSAIAASLGLAAASLGTQTGWSIVSPADRHAIVGLKPTRGLTSRYGVIPISEHLDSVGPMTRHVQDSAILLNALAGPDPNDPWTLAQPAALPDYTERLNADALRGIRIGMPRNAPTYPGTYGGEVHPLILRALNHSVVAFKQLGAVIVDSDFDDTVFEILKNTSSTARMIVGSHDFKVNLEDYLQNYLVSSPVRSMDDIIKWNNRHATIELPPLHDGQEGLYRTNATDGQRNVTYLQAVAALNAVYHTFLISTMETHNVSALIMPTEGWTAELATMAGSPMVTVPLGFFDDSVQPKRERAEDQGWSPLYPAPNIPYGVSFVGRRWDEQNLLGYAYAFEQGTKVRSEARERLREDVRGKV